MRARLHLSSYLVFGYLFALLAGQGASAETSDTASSSPALGLPDRGALESLTVGTGHPEDGFLVLHGSESRQQLVVSGNFSSGQVHDLTRDVAYTAEPQGIVQISDNAFPCRRR